MISDHSNAQTQERANQPTICTTRRREFRPEVENQSPSAVQLEQSPQPDAQSQLARDEGNALLNELEAVLRRFIWLPNERDYTILALWSCVRTPLTYSTMLRVLPCTVPCLAVASQRYSEYCALL